MLWSTVLSRSLSTVRLLQCCTDNHRFNTVDDGLSRHTVVTHFTLLSWWLSFTIIFSLKADVNSSLHIQYFNPIPSAASLSDSTFAQVLALTEDYTRASTSVGVTCSQTDGDSLCGDSPVDPTTSESAATLWRTSKAQQASPRNSVSWQISWGQ